MLDKHISQSKIDCQLRPPWQKQMTQETLYWLFSAIAQTLGAVVGIIGMLAIYKFQLISNHIRTLMENSAHLRGSFFGNKHVSQTAEQFVEEWSKKRIFL